MYSLKKNMFLEDNFKKGFGIPEELNVSAVIGFGYSLKKLTGRRRDHLPLSVLVHNQKYGTSNYK